MFKTYSVTIVKSLKVTFYNFLPIARITDQ